MSYQQRDRNYEPRRGGDFSRDHREHRDPRDHRERNSNGR
jgi:hypothetical protein